MNRLKEEFRIFRSYNESFKKEIVKLVLTGAYSKKEIRREHKLPQENLRRWLIKYGQQVILEEGIERVTLKKLNPNKTVPIKSECEDVTALKRRIKQLENELEEAELRTKVLDKMIEIAERDLKIPIRKKPDTKQSEK